MFFLLSVSYFEFASCVILTSSKGKKVRNSFPPDYGASEISSGNGLNPGGVVVYESVVGGVGVGWEVREEREYFPQRERGREKSPTGESNIPLQIHSYNTTSNF